MLSRRLVRTGLKWLAGIAMVVIGFVLIAAAGLSGLDEDPETGPPVALYVIGALLMLPGVVWIVVLGFRIRRDAPAESRRAFALRVVPAALALAGIIYLAART